jgi:hypothetical protein
LLKLNLKVGAGLLLWDSNTHVAALNTAEKVTITNGSNRQV